VDILTLGSNTALGKGWFRAEAFGHQTFRWVTNDAELYVAAARKAKHYLQIYLEPGPGVNAAPFELIIEEHGEALQRVMVKGRQMISLELPPGEPAVHKLVLRLEKSDEIIAKDSRVLNFRVFKIAFFAAFIDILPPELDARLGPGWHHLESYGGESFRWAGNDAQFTVVNSGDVKALELDLEPGPGVNSAPFLLRILAESGEAIMDVDVTTRQRVTIPLAQAVKGPLSPVLRAE